MSAVQEPATPDGFCWRISWDAMGIVDRQPAYGGEWRILSAQHYQRKEETAGR